MFSETYKATFYFSQCFSVWRKLQDYFLLHLKSLCINDQQRQQKGEHVPLHSTSKYTHLEKSNNKNKQKKLPPPRITFIFNKGRI